MGAELGSVVKPLFAGDSVRPEPTTGAGVTGAGVTGVTGVGVDDLPPAPQATNNEVSNTLVSNLTLTLSMLILLKLNVHEHLNVRNSRAKNAM
jgi:hypothetical protein